MVSPGTPMYALEVFERFLSPSLPQRAACLEVIGEHPRGPAFDRLYAPRIWAAFVECGLLPWASEAVRFAGRVEWHGQPIDRHHRWRDLEVTPLAPAPLTVAAALRLAGDAGAIGAALAVMPAIRAAYAPWGAAPSGGVVLALIPAADRRVIEHDWQLPRAWDLPGRAAWSAVMPFHDDERLRALPPRPYFDAHADFWREACERDLRVEASPPPLDRSSYQWPVELVGTRFADLPDPFAPWRDAFERGACVTGLAGADLVATVAYR
jgi:hypothetical protein